MTFSTAGQRSWQEQTAVEDLPENRCLFSSTDNSETASDKLCAVFVGTEEDVKKTQLEFSCAIPFSIKT